MSRTRIVQVSMLAVMTACLSSVTATGIGAREQERVRILVVDYPRPVAAAVLQIEQLFGWVVTYEDTCYAHPRDIVDVTEQVRRGRNMTKRVLGMRNGTIDLTLAPPAGTVEAQVGEVLQQMLSQSHAVGNAGEFRIDRSSGGYHVVPVAMTGRTGGIAPYASPLDTRITLPYQEESGFEMILRLTSAITTNSRRKVLPGILPMNTMEQARVGVVANNEPARDVVWRALQSISPRLSWQLLCEVGETGQCALNIHVVPKIGPTKEPTDRAQ